MWWEESTKFMRRRQQLPPGAPLCGRRWWVRGRPRLGLWRNTAIQVCNDWIHNHMRREAAIVPWSRSSQRRHAVCTLKDTCDTLLLWPDTSSTFIVPRPGGQRPTRSRERDPRRKGFFFIMIKHISMEESFSRLERKLWACVKLYKVWVKTEIC